MSIEIVHGNLIIAFEKGYINFMAHCCNMQNVMNAGIAKQIRNAFPQAYTADTQWYKGNSPLMFKHVSIAHIKEGQYIANVYGQEFYGTKRKQLNEEYLRSGLTELSSFIEDDDIIGLPYGIGCGLAGGNWDDVYKIIQEVLVNHNVKIYKL